MSDQTRTSRLPSFSQRLGSLSAFADHSEEYVKFGLDLKFYSYIENREISFKAWMSGLSDSFTTNWKSESVFGRPDPYRIYENTERVINLNFNILASSDYEAEQNLSALSNLVRMNYPSYVDASKATTISGAPLMRLKFANLITTPSDNPSPAAPASVSGLPGVINGLAIDFNFDDGVLIDEGGNILPKEISIGLAYYVIHENYLGHDSVGDWADVFNYDPDNFPYPSGINVADGVQEATVTPEGTTTSDTVSSNDGFTARDDDAGSDSFIIGGFDSYNNKPATPNPPPRELEKDFNEKYHSTPQEKFKPPRKPS